MIPDTVSLNAASNNLARAVGPALGGLMVAAFQRVHTGAGSVFALNALSFAGVIWVLVNWRRVPLFKSALPSERIAGSIRSGLRYVRYAPDLQASLVRAFVFTFFISAIWSLLAVVARRDLKQGPLGYGILNGSLGLGAVVAATSLYRIRERFSADQILAASSLYNVVVLLVLAFVRSPSIIIATLVLSGAAWTSTMSTINVSVQLAVPAWVQARALGTYMMVFQGGMALGSILWGYIAEHTTTPIALTSAAFGLLITFPFAYRFHILQGPVPDHTPFQPKRPAPQLTVDTEPTDGPVRISIDYRVPAENYAAFTQAIHKLRGVRLRDGAIRWGIYRDAIDPEHLNETFIMESWLDYLRSRERITAADELIRAQARALHQHDDPPRTTYQIYAKEIANPVRRNSQASPMDARDSGLPYVTLSLPLAPFFKQKEARGLESPTRFRLGTPSLIEMLAPDERSERREGRTAMHASCEAMHQQSQSGLCRAGGECWAQEWGWRLPSWQRNLRR